nr:helix-turn-helix domain-containing protein [Azospirillum humicireducens]
MPAIAIRQDISVCELRRQARLEEDGRVAARLLAIATVLNGHSRAHAARLGGMDRQTLRDWVHRFNAEDVAGFGVSGSRPSRWWKLEGGQERRRSGRLC